LNKPFLTLTKPNSVFEGGKKMSRYETKNYAGSLLGRYKATLSLTQEQKDLIIGTLLGDSTMGLRHEKKLYALKFEQQAANLEYVNHLYEIMEPYVGTPPVIRKNKDTGEIKSFWFRTYRHDNLIFYFDLFYKIEDKNGKKIAVKRVPKNIHKILNARVLAYWFMDDGTLSGQNYYFSTQAFEKHEVERLSNALKTCFGIKSSVHKDKGRWRLYINSDSSSLLESLIMPYLHEIFFYKIRKRPQNPALQEKHS
jgi:hypothetical protein